MGMIDSAESSPRSIHASVSGQRTSFNNVYVNFTLRHRDFYDLGLREVKYYEKEMPEIDEIAVRYYPLSGDDASYSGMARAYREVLFGSARSEAAKCRPRRP